MALHGMAGSSTAGPVATNSSVKLRSLYSPELGDESNWWFGGWRKRHLVRVVY